MKIKTKIFGKIFFELETDRDDLVSANSLTESSVVSEPKGQMKYEISETQYNNLVVLMENISFIGTHAKPKEESFAGDVIDRFHNSLNIIENLIKSYEHFADKRKAHEKSE